MSDSSLPIVTMRQNKEHAGIELVFSSKPNRSVIESLKQNGFRWHNKKQLWCAKSTPERLEFARTISGADSQELTGGVDFSSSSQQASAHIESDPQNAGNAISNLSERDSKVPNTFAASYDSIGDAQILPKAEGDLFSCMEAFFEEEKLYFRRTYGGDTITLLDLTNAQKAGAICDEWRISSGYFEQSSLLTLLDRAGVDNVHDLLVLCRSDKAPDGLSISRQEHKGVDVFSPFVEVKPLKCLPEKWTKRNFTQALMSGQLYRGEVAYRYTDDYAYDAAVGFRTGVALDMPSFVKKQVGDWGSCTTCYNARTDDKDEHGGNPVHYSEHSNSSKTLWFDVNCDIAEGKKRAENRGQSIARYNSMLEDSCIKISPDQIDPGKCYTLVTLDTNTNDGMHMTKEEILQGHVLQHRLGPDGFCPPILKAEELTIEPERFYVIADFFNRRECAEDDIRVISCGNWKQIVTGKALLELTGEGVYVPVIHSDDNEYGTYYSARKKLMDQATGRSRFMFSKQEDFIESLSRLETEYQRAGHRRLDDIIQDASARQTPYEFGDVSPERTH